MGLTQSKDKLNDNSNLDSETNLEYIINNLIADFIVSQNFEDMEKLSDSNYCNKIVLITSKLLDEKLDLEEVTYLSDNINKTSKEKVFVLNSKNLEDMDEEDKIKKKYLCNGLAKFYVQIATIYAAIAKTINPKLAYNDENRNEINISFKDKDKVPSTQNTYVKGISLCSSRVSSLLNGQSFTDFLKDAELGTANLNPNICTFNCSTCPITKSLDNEPGIPELENLYYDQFNYKTGKFDEMSESMKLLYQFDLINFYKVFTGNDSLPESVKRFSDIKLKDYYNSTNCQDGDYSQEVSLDKTTKPYFLNYIENLKSMLKKIKVFHNQLLVILEEIFTVTESSSDEKKSSKNKISLNPSLTEPRLIELNISVIKIINNLYLYCELRYLKGIELYMDLINSLKLQKTKSILGISLDQDEDQDQDDLDQDLQEYQDEDQDLQEDKDELDQDLKEDKDELDQDFKEDSKDELDQDEDELDQDEDELIQLTQDHKEDSKDQLNQDEEEDPKEQFDEKKQEKIEQLKEQKDELINNINLIKKDYFNESNKSFP